MNNYCLTLQYEGTRYDGWQKQGNTKNTIQGRLETILTQLCDEPITLIGSGRTDAGAHAAGQKANFHTQKTWQPETLLTEVNRRLPRDIGVVAVSIEKPAFHARFSAKEKTYCYRVWNSTVPNVLSGRYYFQSPAPLDISAMEQAAALFLGEHDFQSFCAARPGKKSTVCTIYTIDIDQKGPKVAIWVRGNGFLYQMVRILCGTLLEVGEGKRPAESMQALLEAKNRSLAGITLPARGLMLMEVRYDHDEK